MVRYCSNIKCKLWEPIRQKPTEASADLKDPTLSNPSIVGLCGCIGATREGDCLRCGGL